MALYQKLLEIQKEIQGLAPDGTGFNYKYVTASKVSHYMKPLMNKYGLLLKQEIHRFFINYLVFLFPFFAYFHKEYIQKKRKL